MKKIEFGYANDIEPTGSWEGIGIKEGMLLTEADYYGSVSYEGNSYIVAKVTEDENGRFQQLVGNFIVRDAVLDVYPDGSGLLFLDQEPSISAEQLERFLNREEIKDKINSISDVLSYCNGAQRSNPFYTLLEMREKIISTSITHEAFEAKNEALKSCRGSFIQTQKELNALKEGMGTINR